MHCTRMTRSAVLGVTLLWLCAVVCAAPTVEKTPDAITVKARHYTAIFSPVQGGALSELRDAAGQVLTTGHFLYTDHGVYTEGAYFGTAHATGAVEVQEGDGEVTVLSTGSLCDAGGKPGTDPGATEYRLEYLITDAPEVRIDWTATPRFDREVKRGFFAYVLSVSGCVGLFANTLDGVLLQDMATESGRSFQSAAEPLSLDAPWFGVMRQDGSAIAFTELRGTPPVENAFMHEDGKGGGGVFFTWPGAGQLRAGEPWRGGVTVRLGKTMAQAVGEE